VRKVNLLITISFCLLFCRRGDDWNVSHPSGLRRLKNAGRETEAGPRDRRLFQSDGRRRDRPAHRHSLRPLGSSAYQNHQTRARCKMQSINTSLKFNRKLINLLYWLFQLVQTLDFSSLS